MTSFDMHQIRCDILIQQLERQGEKLEKLSDLLVNQSVRMHKFNHRLAALERKRKKSYDSSDSDSSDKLSDLLAKLKVRTDEFNRRLAAFEQKRTKSSDSDSSDSDYNSCPENSQVEVEEEKFLPSPPILTRESTIGYIDLDEVAETDSSEPRVLQSPRRKGVYKKQ
jgi:uncharacterized coiled-coil protein SlyX